METVAAGLARFRAGFALLQCGHDSLLSSSMVQPDCHELVLSNLELRFAPSLNG